MHVVGEGEVEGAEVQALIDQRYHYLVVRLQLLHHIQARLESWLVVGISRGALLGGSAESDQDASKLRVLSEHVVLKEQVQCLVVLVVHNVLKEHRLKHSLLRDTVL